MACPGIHHPDDKYCLGCLPEHKEAGHHYPAEPGESECHWLCDACASGNKAEAEQEIPRLTDRQTAALAERLSDTWKEYILNGGDVNDVDEFWVFLGEQIMSARSIKTLSVDVQK